MYKTHKPLTLHVQSQNNAALLLIAGGFLLGGIFGCVMAASVSGNGSLALSSYIQEFLTAMRNNTAAGPGLISAGWTVLRWPLLVMILSCSTLGVLGIPAVFFLRGFLFAFCISAFVQVLGASGLVFALLLLGVESFISIPVLFLLGSHALLRAASTKERRGKGRTGKILPQAPSSIFRYAVCALLLFFCMLWEAILLPLLLANTSGLIPS